MKNDHLIFADPPEAIDETWRHGGMLGGMTGYDDQSLAQSYFLAANMLIEQVLTTGERGQEVICPVLYLYRHGVELHLKVIVKPGKLNHNIGLLFEAMCKHVKEKYGEVVPSWLTTPIGQLAEFDPNSDLFRYGNTKNPAIARNLTNAGEFWVDLPKLKKTMSIVERAFIRIMVAEAEGLEGLKRFIRHA